jgi:hypothetical protein
VGKDTQDVGRISWRPLTSFPCAAACFFAGKFCLRKAVALPSSNDTPDRAAIAALLGLVNNGVF